MKWQAALLSVLVLVVFWMAVFKLALHAYCIVAGIVGGCYIGNKTAKFAIWLAKKVYNL